MQRLHLLKSGNQGSLLSRGISVGCQGACSCAIRPIWLTEEEEDFVFVVLLGAPLQGSSGGGGKSGSQQGSCVCHLSLGTVPWRLTQISPLGQRWAPP